MKQGFKAVCTSAVRHRLRVGIAQPSDEAYLSADPRNAYLLYFTDGGSVGLDLREYVGTFQVAWVDISKGTWFADEDHQRRHGRNPGSTGKQGLGGHDHPD